MTGSLGPTSTYATPSPRKSLSKFTDCLARPGQSRRSPHSAAHTRREHRMPSKPLAALCYARHSPGLTPLAARSAAHARARLPGSLLHGGGPARASTGSGSRSHERPPARAARSMALALVTYFQLRALRRRPLPASSPAQRRRCRTSPRASSQVPPDGAVIAGPGTKLTHPHGHGPVRQPPPSELALDHEVRGGEESEEEQVCRL